MFFHFLLLGGVLAAETTREEKQMFEFGKRFMEDRLYEMAESKFDTLLSQFPQSEFRGEAIVLLARARLKQGKWREALDGLDQQVPVASQMVQDQLLLLAGEAQLQGSLMFEAMRSFQNLMAKFPESQLVTEAKFGLARAFVQQQKFVEASELLKFLQKEAPRDLAVQATLTYGIALGLQKQYDKAYEILQRLIKDERGHSVAFQAYYALGEIDFDRKRFDSARKNFDMIVQSERSEAQGMVPSALLRLGQIEEGAQNLMTAATDYEQAFRKSDDVSFRLKCVDELSRVYLQLEKVDVLAEKLRGWSGEYAKTRFGEALLLEECTLWQKAGKRDSAIRAFQDFFEKFPDGYYYDRARFQLGWVFLEDKKFESASAEFQKAAERARSPQNQLEALLKLADLYWEQKDDSNAAVTYLKASEVKGGDPQKLEQALYQGALVFQRMGKVSEVQRLHQLHGNQYPEGKRAPEFLLLLAEAQERGRDLSHALESYRTFLERYPASSVFPKSWIQYAEALLVSGNAQAALQEATGFLDKNPKHEFAPRARLIRARSMERLDQPDKALAEYQSIVQDFPKTSQAIEALFSMGAYYDRQKNYAKAQEHFEWVRAGNPQHPLAAEAVFFAARAAYRLGQRKGDASRLIELLVKDYPTSPWTYEARFLYGDILTEQGKFEDALLIFSDLTQVDEGSKNPPPPERLLEAQGRKGQCLRQLNKHSDSLVAFKNILSSPKADPSLRNQAYVEIAKTYEAMGNVKQAIENNLAPLYERHSKASVATEREYYWISKGALEAVRLVEAQKDWRGAAQILKRMKEANLPVRLEVEERLKRLQSEHAEAN